MRIHSTRYEIAFLAGEMIGKMPPRFFAMPCAEVDRILAAGAQPHFVGKSDAIAMLELGGENSTSAGDVLDYAEFGELVSGLTRERQGQFFKHPICLPLSRAVHQERPDQGAATIDVDGGIVFDTIDQTRILVRPTADQILAALNVLHQYELSEYGLENLAAPISEGRRILDIDQAEGAAIDEAALRDLIRAAMTRLRHKASRWQAGRGSTAFIHDFFAKIWNEGDELSARQGPAHEVTGAGTEAETEVATEAGTEAVVFGRQTRSCEGGPMQTSSELLLTVASRPKHSALSKKGKWCIPRHHGDRS